MSYPPQGGYPPQPGGYPPQPGHPGQPGGYPPQPGAPGGYPPQPGAPGGYPPQPGAPGGYPPQPGGYPPQPGAPGGYGQPGYGQPPGMGNVYGAPGSDGFGRDTLFGNTPVESNEAFALQNGKMLKVTLGQQSGMKELFAKSGSMIAYQGGVTFDGNSRSWAQQQTSRMTRQVLPLMKVSGAGTVYFANQAQDLFILELKGDSFTIDKDNLLAFSPGLRWDVVRVDTGGQSVGGMDAFNIELTGNGHFVCCSQGAPLVMNVDPTNYYFADADAVLGWSSSLAVSMQAAVTSSSVTSMRANTGEGWQMNFSGEGQVIVQPAEMLPPFNAVATNAQGVPQSLGDLFGGSFGGNSPFGGR
jgi:uncharacterized protein (AIM24 family)